MDNCSCMFELAADGVEFAAPIGGVKGWLWLTCMDDLIFRQVNVDLSRRRSRVPGSLA